MEDGARWPDTYLHLRGQELVQEAQWLLTHCLGNSPHLWLCRPFLIYLLPSIILGALFLSVLCCSIVRHYYRAGLLSETVGSSIQFLLLHFRIFLMLKERKELKVKSWRFTQLGHRLQMRKTSRLPKEKGKPRSFYQLRLALPADCARRWDHIA